MTKPSYTASDVGALASGTVVTNVAFTAATDNAEYPILMKNSTGNATDAGTAKFGNTSGKGVTINPSTGVITAAGFSGALSGNASSASAISISQDQTHITYLVGTTSNIATTGNYSLSGDKGVYLTATAGELSAYRYSWHYGTNEKAYTFYNSTDDSIDFIFV